ncbi:hypothetical protein [Legionella jamestowniensis]|uniref:RNA binding protein (Contains ribosomal protein S1 domain) n=1 Tax=Legionella jamestowniensis TaxID=455 RepID=A0A0W0UGK6_9GAMM|nr:hypothetical protein [Legionella jamestowniensis]KTD07042.1 RNA binding protein (contains ribosomal protein S1 domain) [Legionella jamestowniensis]OCH96729.1 hypothetical protein A8135_06095 [Legionella jamestowniensis]SFM03352.1 hypothetical protein SAMN02746073_0043 [Legionella jamestowniensis DSM 19215]
MIILYIPFSRDVAGDLLQLAKQWIKNYQQYTKEDIVLHCHEDEHKEDHEGLITVFILAHGADNVSDKVANHTDSELSTWISIGTMTDRFNQDMLPVAHHISSIHLYSCGTKQTNHTKASSFQHGFLRAESKPVYYYAGSIYGPNQNGEFLSEVGNKFYPSSQFRYQLFKSLPTEGEDHRESVKKTPAWMLAEAKEKKRDHFFSNNKKQRLALFNNNRKINDDSKICILDNMSGQIVVSCS